MPSRPTATLPELLAPAGTPAKLRTALHFGADAVYLGLQHLSLRAAAGNFTLEQLEWALGFAHERGRRVLVAVNVQPFDEELGLVEETLADLARLPHGGPDGVIVADAGVLEIARRVAPRLPLHLSTQASVTNAPGARFWSAAGIRRICAARELSLAQLSRLVAEAGVPIEAFVHGAVCVAWSGRCFLSLYWADRDPRHGDCAQACRWPYRLIEDRRRPGEGNPVEADERGTYFFDAKDLCALPVLDRLVATGVAALKIEGRTRSEHYVGVVVDVYRDALDRLAAGDDEGFRARQASWLAELGRPTHRGFSTQFLEGKPGAAAYSQAGSSLAHENDYLGKVVAVGEGRIDVALANPVRPGDRVELRDRGLRRLPFTVGEVRGLDDAPLDYGRSPRTVRLASPARVEAGALLRLARPDPAADDRKG